MRSDGDEHGIILFVVLASQSLAPRINQPARIALHSKFLIDDFLSDTSPFSQGRSKPISIFLSNHLTKFPIIPLESCFAPKSVLITKNSDNIVRVKDPIFKSEMHVSVTKHQNKMRGMVAQDMKRFLNGYFYRGISNVKKTLNGIGYQTTNIRRQNISLLSNNRLNCGPGRRPEISNGYFSSITNKLRSKIKLVAENFSWCLRKANFVINVAEPLIGIKVRHGDIRGAHIHIEKFKGKIESLVTPRVNFSLILDFSRNIPIFGAKSMAVNGPGFPGKWYIRKVENPVSESKVLHFCHKRSQHVTQERLTSINAPRKSPIQLTVLKIFFRLMVHTFLLSILMTKTSVAKIPQVGELDNDLGVLRFDNQNNSRWRRIPLISKRCENGEFGKFRTINALRRAMTLDRAGVG